MVLLRIVVYDVVEVDIVLVEVVVVEAVAFVVEGPIVMVVVYIASVQEIEIFI